MFGLVAIALFLALNGLFVAAEFALVKLRATYVGEKPKPRDMIGHAVEKIERYLSVTQLGITLASLGLGWIGEPALADLVRQGFLAVFGREPGHTVEGVIVGIAFALLTFAHVLLGELVPKLIAIQRSQAVAAFALWPLRITFHLLRPALFLLETSSRAILSRFGLSLDQTESSLSEDEILGVLAAHVAHGKRASDKQELVRRMMRFATRTAKQAMVPRVDVMYVPIGVPGATVLEFLRAHEYSRVPLSEGEELDHVVGYLYWKDFLRDARNVRLPDLTSLRRDVLFVAESQGLVDVLREMQRKQTPFAVVVDEYGGTSGILTMEDLLEEIVGEIHDEADAEPMRIVRKRDGSLEVDGGVQLDELAEMGFDVGEHEHGATVSGAMLMKLGRIPHVGDKVDLGEVEAEVAHLARRRIVRVGIRKKNAAENA